MALDTVEGVRVVHSGDIDIHNLIEIWLEHHYLRIKVKSVSAVKMQ